MTEKDMGTEVFGPVHKLVGSSDAVESAEPVAHQHHKSHGDDCSLEIIVLEVETSSGHGLTTHEHLGGPSVLIDGVKQYAKTHGLVYASTKAGQDLLIRQEDLEDGHSCAQYSQHNPRPKEGGKVVSETKCSICNDWCIREYELENYETTRHRKWGL